jgi:hypothetical protein
MKLRSAIITTCVALGATAGAFTVTAALSTHSDGSQSSTIVRDAPDPMIFEPTSGSEPVAFEFDVTSSAGTENIEILSVGADKVCVKVHLHDGEGDLCFDERTVSSGLAYGIFGEPDGRFTLVGVVPDEVDTVEITGLSVKRAGNIWTASADSDAPAVLRVGNSVSGRFITLGGAAD